MLQPRGPLTYCGLCMRLMHAFMPGVEIRLEKLVAGAIKCPQAPLIASVTCPVTKFRTARFGVQPHKRLVEDVRVVGLRFLASLKRPKKGNILCFSLRHVARLNVARDGRKHLGY